MPRLPKINSRTVTFLLSGLILVLLAGFFWAAGIINGTDFGRRTEGELKKYAETILEKCSSEKYKAPCFDREIPKLVDSIGMEDAFGVTRFVQKEEPAYLYCHVLGHNIAESETRKDPSKWKDVVARCPTTMCNNGCPHGALMERFKNNVDYLTDEQIESIKPDLSDVCEPRNTWNPREVERSMCYHALGHLNMYITNGDLRRSADLCEEIGVKSDGRSYVQTCTEGVFMSVYQPLGPEDIALVKDIVPSKEKMPEFCSQFKESPMSYHACHKEAWAIFRQEIFTSDGYYKFCTYTDDKDWQDSCFRSLLNPITDSMVIEDNDIEGVLDFCGGLPAHSKNICVYSVVQRLMQVDPVLASKALEVCGSSATRLGEEPAKNCYDSLLAFGRIGFLAGSQELRNYCELLPEPWRGKCLDGKWY